MIFTENWFFPPNTPGPGYKDKYDSNRGAGLSGIKILCTFFGLLCLICFLVYILPWSGLNEMVFTNSTDLVPTRLLMPNISSAGQYTVVQKEKKDGSPAPNTSKAKEGSEEHSKAEDLSKSVRGSPRKYIQEKSRSVRRVRGRLRRAEPGLEEKPQSGCLPFGDEAVVYDKVSGEYLRRARVVFGEEGQDLKLVCSLCRPARDPLQDFLSGAEEEQEAEQVTWSKRELDGGDFHELDIDEGEDGGLALSPRGDLLLENAATAQAGFYQCLVRNVTLAVYRLDIVKREPRVEVVPREGEYPGRYPRDNQSLPPNNLLIYTAWGQWTPCSRSVYIPYKSSSF